MYKNNSLYEYAVLFDKNNALFIKHLQSFLKDFEFWFISSETGLTKQGISNFMRGVTHPRLQTLSCLTSFFIRINDSPLPPDHPGRKSSREYVIKNKLTAK